MPRQPTPSQLFPIQREAVELNVPESPNMKLRTIVLVLTAALSFASCSKENTSSPKVKRLVPTTAAEIEASPDFKLEHTTKAGIKLYVQELTPEVAKTVGFESPDHEFLQGDEQSPYYFLVMIRDGKIIDSEAAGEGALRPEETGELIGFMMKRDKGFQEVLKEATK